MSDPAIPDLSPNSVPKGGVLLTGHEYRITLPRDHQQGLKFLSNAYATTPHDMAQRLLVNAITHSINQLVMSCVGKVAALSLCMAWK